jgi:hypothetical protein
LGTSEKTLDDMCQWVVAQPGVENAYPERHENEEYAPDPA